MNMNDLLSRITALDESEPVPIKPQPAPAPVTEDSVEEFVACIVDFDQSGTPKVLRSKPVSKERAEEIIAGAKAKDKFKNPLFKTIYPASAGKLDAESIMKQFPDLSKTESMGAQGDIGGAHGDETISPIHGGQKEQPTMENLNLESLRYLSGINKTIAECGMGGPSTPASINITAGSGSELTGMLKDIMNLAGVHQVTPDHMPIDKGPSAIVNAPPMAAEPQMKDLIAMVDEPEDGPHADSMNDADDEQEDEGMLMKGLGGMGGGAAGELAGGAIGTAVGGPIGGAIGSVAGDIAGTALGSELGDDDDEQETDEGSGEKEKNRPWDSSPHEKIRQDGVRKFGDQNSGDGKGRIGTQPNAHTTESIAARLYADYKAFVSEAAADEPAAPDADAIAKRKRLQAIKDKQEDDAAEKGSSSSSTTRKIAGKAYGGAAQKDDSDED